MTPENVRHIAAGQLAAAVLVADAGMAAAAKLILRDVLAYMNAPSVACPNHLKRAMEESIAGPVEKIADLRRMADIFVDPLNSKIEAGNGGFGT